jgi:long-chain acyl-CoA synthetase
VELEDHPNLVAMLLRQAAEKSDQPFMWEKRDGAYQPMSWREAADQALALASALAGFGLKAGDRVLVLSQNSPRWAIADFGIMAAGGVTVPVYTTNTVENHEHILNDSGAAMAIVSSAALAKNFLPAAKKARALKRIVAMEDFGDADVGRTIITPWSEALAVGRPGVPAFAESARAIDRNALACLIYTSGTGGEPKGVMLSHRAIIANCVGAWNVLKELGLENEVFLSFLPLSHAYEHTAGLMFPVSLGAQIYFAERIETLATNLTEARPTIMTAVPRLYDILRERIIKGLAQQPRYARWLFWKAVELGRKRYESPALLTAKDKLIDRLAEKLVREKIRARFGGRLKALVSGGAALDYDVGVFFVALGVRLLQGYGQTEAAPVIAVNRCSRVKLRTVGPPMKLVEAKIADDGEILVRGPMLMEGYWNQPKLTQQTIRDGWLHTGDIGVLDHDGYLQITDRKRDIIVNSAGDTISPARIENALALEPEIEAAVAVGGDSRAHIVAVVVPAAQFAEDWAKRNGRTRDLAALSGDKDFRAAIGRAVDRTNLRLGAHERVRNFVLADEPFTIENGMMTPTLKPRRHNVLKRWGLQLEQVR